MVSIEEKKDIAIQIEAKAKELNALFASAHQMGLKVRCYTRSITSDGSEVVKTYVEEVITYP